MTADIAPRRIEYVRLDQVALAERNPKLHDDAGISHSIRHHGFGESPMRDERTGRLVAGHGRIEQLLALHAEGADAPDGIQVDDDGMWRVPVQAGWASKSDSDAESYLILANRLSEKGGWDDRTLTELLGDLAGDNLLELTGYDTDDLDDLLAELEESPALPPLPGAPDPAPQQGDGNPADRGEGVRQYRGMDDLEDDYQASNHRMIVLTFTGDVYVWLVNKLSHLITERDVESNSDVVLRLVEDATGEKAPQGG